MQYGWELLTKEEESLIEQGIKDNKIYGGPFHLVLFPTDRCNLNCFFCYTEELRQIADELEWEVLKPALEEGIRLGVKGVSLGGGGESLIYRNIHELLAFIETHSLTVDSIKTNGTALTPEIARSLIRSRLKRITISLNDPDPDAFVEIARSSKKLYAKAMEGIQNIIDAKREADAECEISIQVFAWKENFRRVPEMIMALKDTGTDLIYVNSIDQLPEEQRLTESEREEFKEIIREVVKQWAPILRFNLAAERLDQFAAEEQYKYSPEAIDVPDLCKTPERIEYCYVGWYSPVIAASGDVYPCCHFAVDKNKSLGNLHEQSLETIWYGPHAQQFRTEMRHLLLTGADKALLPRNRRFIMPLCLERTACAFNFYLASPDFYYRIHDWAESGARAKYKKVALRKSALLKAPRAIKRTLKSLLQGKAR